MKKILLSLIALLMGTWAMASHVPGGQITYECIGPNTYRITLTLFEDCSTAFTGTTPETINITNDCGLVNPPALSATQTSSGPDDPDGYQYEISQLCPTALSTCEGGAYPGTYQHTYTAVVTLPGGCDSWHFSYTSCCRNIATNSSAMDSYYWEATLNNADAPCNTSPFFAAAPIPYVCVGEPVCYSFGVIETDGDSISFAFIDALATGPADGITYSAGFTGAVPIPGITIDPETGQINFTPTVAGNYIVCVQITEYDEDGNIIGTIIRDIQFVVINCINDIVDCATAGTIPTSSITGAVVQTGPTSLQMCEGVPFCFTVSFTDPDPADILTLTSNVGLVLPGSTITTTSGNTATAQICWEPPAGSAGAYNSFSIVVKDNACPVSGVQTIVYTMDVIGGTVANPNIIICGDQEANLLAEGGSTFTWSVLSGEPITVGSNFSCNPCANPVATPSVTTTYLVTSDLTGACTNVDTTTVFVVPNFEFSVTQTSSTACLLSDIGVNTTITGGTGTGPFTYEWTPDDVPGFGPTNSATPTFTPSAPGAYDFVLTVSNAAGCTYTDTVQVSVAPSYAPDVTAASTMDTVMCGDIVGLEVVLGCGVPATCGAAILGSSCGAPNTVTVGTFTAQNTTYSYPTPFGHYYQNEKHQFLYTAAELNAMGFLGGQITSMGYNVISMGGIPGGTYPGYTVKMACTGLTALPSTSWGMPFAVEPFTTVYGPANYTANVGASNINFTTAFNWDGVSNILVEVCYNLTPPYTTNCIVQLANTPFTSSMWFNSDGTAACPYTTISSGMNQRPVTRFTYSLSGSDSTDYTYAWTPGATPSTTMSTTAAPCTTTTYQVVVTDIAGGCTDTAYVTVFVDKICFPPNLTPTHLTCNNDNTGAILAEMVGDTGPWDVDLKTGTTLISTHPGVTDTISWSGLAAGTYTVVIHDTTGCSDSTTITITQPLPVTLATSANDTICINGSFVFSTAASGGTGPYNYVWSNPSGYSSTSASNTVLPTVNDYYVVNATDSRGCVADDDTVYVYLYPGLTAATSGNVQICMESSTLLTAGATGGMGAPYTFTWYQTGNPSPISTSSSVTVSPLNNNTEYCVVVSDACTTPDDNACLIVSFFPEPYPSVSLDTARGCAPVTVNFTNNTNPALVQSVVWDFGDGSTATDPLATTHTYLLPNVDCYDVSIQITSGDGCVHDTTLVDAVCALGFPTASFSYHPQPIDVLNTEVTFDNYSSPDVVANQWYFYDSLNNLLGSSNLPNPIFEYPDNGPGEYPVWLVVTNNNGCVDSVELSVIVMDIFTMYIPNAFTPDGNGVNEEFMPRGSNFDIDEYEFTIFDRWGTVIFKTTDMLKGWDGTQNGLKCKSDVYVWKIKVKNALNQERTERIGHVTLLR